MRAQFVNENIGFERGYDPRDIMRIGDPKARAERKLEAFADKMEWVFWKTPKGIWTITTPLDVEIAHNMESTGGFKGTYNYGSFNADSLRYKISWVEGWGETPLSLRKAYMKNGEEVKQNLMDRFEDIDEVIMRIKLNYPKELRRAGINEQIRFNFENPPYKKYISKKGIRGPQVSNPRKAGYQGKLTDEEEEIVGRHTERVRELEDEIRDFEYEIEDLRGELDNLTSNSFSEGELEQFYADVQNEYGFKGLDILNSGYSKEEKIKLLDALNPDNDEGIKEFVDLLDTYNWYHPEEPDEEKVEEIKQKIEKIERQKKERENTTEKLQTKIWNLQNY
jgi:anti-sigma28 factor (negative regulator of flagellin synthesis)